VLPLCCHLAIYTENAAGKAVIKRVLLLMLLSQMMYGLFSLE
jgi:hypothetical protein